MASNGGSFFLCVVCVASVFASGCAPKPPMPKVAESLSCSAENITIDGPAWARVARGCGRVDVFSGESSWGSLRKRAAFDFGCTANDLEITIIDDDTFGVTGCGQKVTYKYAYGAGFVSDTFRPIPAPTQQTYVPPPPPPPPPAFK